MTNSINFPNLNIYLDNVGKSIDIGGFSIAYYGIVIAIGMVLAVSLVLKLSKMDGLDDDAVFDLALVTIVSGVVGARLYYVAFSWSYYKDDLISILNLRQGGLAIYGGILFGIAAIVAMCKVKKIEIFRMLDIAACGVLVGQILGRWGNFFNREVFGGYTDNLLAMELPLDAIRSMDDVTEAMLANARVVDGVTYIQVHPTFLYESLWNLAILIALLIYFKRRRFFGELTLYYMFFYGLGRAWIEQVRTDQLKLWGTNIPVSQALAIVIMIASVVLYVILWRRHKRQPLEAADAGSSSKKPASSISVQSRRPNRITSRTARRYSRSREARRYSRNRGRE